MAISVRCNNIKTNPSTLKKALVNSGVEISPITWYEDAFIVHNLDAKQLTSLDSYRQGEFYIQNLSSFMPALILDPQPGEDILDMCAAPGGKTSHIASITQNNAHITALDISRDRLFKLQAVLDHQGVTGVQLRQIPGQIAWKQYPEAFDKVLLDAPCSMQQESGPDSKKAKLLAPKQHYLLRSALSCCRVGGTIVYSTCSTSRVENEQVIDWLLKKETGRVVGEFQVRILPDPLAQGFFVAKFTKTASNISQ